MDRNLKELKEYEFIEISPQKITGVHKAARQYSISIKYKQTETQKKNSSIHNS